MKSMPLVTFAIIQLKNSMFPVSSYFGLLEKYIKDIFVKK